MKGRALHIGLISDTHGLLRPEAVDFLRGGDRILHAGDVYERRVLDELGEIAPTVAVRGNNDRGEWAGFLLGEEIVETAASTSASSTTSTRSPSTRPRRASASSSTATRTSR